MLPLVAIGVVVLVVVVVASALLRSPDPTADEAGSQQGESAAPQYAPTGPGSDPALDGDDVLRDSFERSGEPGELGDFPDVGPWVTGRGAWAVSGGILQLSNGETTAPNVAWVDPGATDLRAQVTLTEPEKGAGLAFRIQDADNFWLWLVVPEYSTVALVRVEDAEAEVIDNPGLVAMRPGMTVGVHLVGSTIELLAQGVVVMTVEDADPPQGTGLGVGVAIGETTAAFSELAFVRAS